MHIYIIGAMEYVISANKNLFNLQCKLLILLDPVGADLGRSGQFSFKLNDYFLFLYRERK